MNHSLLLSILSALLMLFSTAACAESPSAIVGERPLTDSGSLDEGDKETEITVPAITFLGSHAGGGECNVYISMVEVEEHDGHHHHEMLVRTELMTSDGHRPSDSTAKFYLYDDASKTYYDPSSNQANTITTIVGLRVNGVEDPSPNDSQDYERTLALEQLLRLEFFGTDAESLETSLEDSIASGSLTAEASSAFGSLDLVFGRLRHNGDHYHGETCVRLRLQSELTEVTFELGGGHDHDHDHGDDGHHHHDH